MSTFASIVIGTTPTPHVAPAATSPVTPRLRRHRAKLRADDARDYRASCASVAATGTAGHRGDAATPAVVVNASPATTGQKRSIDVSIDRAGT